MDTSLSIPPEYAPALFVDRDDEIEQVVNLVRELAAGRSAPRRTVIFRGERGCGKTWLLRHLTENAYTPAGDSPGPTGGCLKLEGVKSWYLSLNTISGAKPEEKVSSIVRALRRQIGEWQGVTPGFSDVENLSLYKLSALVTNEVRALLQEHVLVLIFDHVYESSSELLGVLEDRLLAQLTRFSKLLIVMAGRGRGYVWKTPELRLYFQEYWLQGLGVPATQQPPPPPLTRVTVVKPEQVKATEEQLRRQLPQLSPIDTSCVKEILSVTHGHPLGNLLRGVGRSYSEIVDELLRSVSQRDQQLLRLVCVLRFFGEPQISGLLAACRDDDEFKGIAGMHPPEIIGTLLRTDLVRFDTNLAAYVMDEVVRSPLEGDLQKRFGDLWRQLHEAAWMMYCRWVREYPQAKERLQAEAYYHAERLGKGACLEPQAHEES